MQREGTLHVVRPGDPAYQLGFSDYALREVATKHREIATDEALRRFMLDQLKIGSGLEAPEDRG